MSTDWSDNRNIADVRFAAHLTDEKERSEAEEQVRGILQAAGVETVNELIQLGCVGLASRLVKTNYFMGAATIVRQNMAGTGFGLTCFVGMDRFCFVHNGIGGLMDGQNCPYTPEEVAQISRPLTPEEAAKVRTIETIRRKTGGKSADKAAQTIRDLAEETADTDGGNETGGSWGEHPAAFIERHLRTTGESNSSEEISLFVCQEHVEVNWSCRFCIAQQIVEGPYEPALMIGAGEKEAVDMDNVEPIRGADIQPRVDKEEELGSNDSIVLYVRAATWRRRMTRV